MNQMDNYESALILNDLSPLTPVQRLAYVKGICDSLRLNPLTQPFGFIAFRNGELKLYAKRDCTDQLRARDKISVGLPEKIEMPGCIAFRIIVSTPEGRTDSAVGAVAANGLSGEALANAVMKAETKAKRRATLSICGLGIPDELEVETIPGAKVVDVNYDAKAQALPNVSELPKPEPVGEFFYLTSKLEDPKRSDLECWLSDHGIEQIGPGVWKAPRELKKLAEIRVEKPPAELPFDDDVPGFEQQKKADETPLEKAKKRAAKELEAKAA